MSKSSMRKIALTGGTGFLGVQIAAVLKARGYETVLLKRPDCDFNDHATLSFALKDCDAVIHCAGVVGYGASLDAVLRESNVELTRKMLEAAREARVPRFVQVSSIVTLGMLGSGEGLRDETASYNAENLNLTYWQTKYESEKLALAENGPGFEVVVVNPGTLLGKGERSGQFTAFVKKLSRLPLALLPSGGSDFVDVADAALGCVLALEKGRAGERYILGAENLSYAEIYQRVRKITGLASRAIALPRPLLSVLAGVTRSARMRRVNGVFLFHDISKARRELGYAPKPIDDSLRAMLEE